MGGATGFVSAAIAQRYPWLRFIVQDLPLMIKNCESGRSHIPKELLPRIQFQAHNFFTPQPVKGAAVYLFRWILHNWSDKYVVKILENLIPGLEPGSRIVINDICLPEPNTEGLVEENVLRYVLLPASQLLYSHVSTIERWTCWHYK